MKVDGTDQVIRNDFKRLVEEMDADAIEPEDIRLIKADLDALDYRGAFDKLMRFLPDELVKKESLEDLQRQLDDLETENDATNEESDRLENERDEAQYCASTGMDIVKRALDMGLFDVDGTKAEFLKRDAREWVEEMEKKPWL